MQQQQNKPQKQQQQQNNRNESNRMNGKSPLFLRNRKGWGGGKVAEAKGRRGGRGAAR